MNRNKEYWDLISALGDTPDGLDSAVARATARRKKTRAGKWLGIPVATLGGLVSAFILLVNFSIPFALACARVPFLKDLTAAVAFDPSLKAAVENDYIQPILQSQTKDGVTLTLEYLIADKSRLNVFYTLKSEGEALLETHPSLADIDDGYASTASNPNTENGYRIATFYFIDTPLPDHMTLEFPIYDTGYSKETATRINEAPAQSAGSWIEESEKAPDPISTFHFEVAVDTTILVPDTEVDVGREITLDGQTIEISSLIINPTNMELRLADRPENTAWLTGLTCYAEDERGNRYESANGVSAFSDPDTHFSHSRFLESPYFSGTEHLTLTITGARWLDKDRTSITVNLDDGTADWLPDGVTLESAERQGANVNLAIRNDGQSAMFGNYFDPEGGEHDWGGYSVSAYDRDEDGYCEESTEYRTLRNYPWNTVTIALTQGRSNLFEEPITVALK